MSTSRISRVTRRRFLKETGLTLAAAGAAPRASPRRSCRGHWPTPRRCRSCNGATSSRNTTNGSTHFAKDWGDKNKIAVTVDHIPVQNVAARAAAEASAGSGHDLFGWNGSGGAHLYRKFLVDMTSLVEATEKKYGKVSTIGRQIGYNQDDKTWSAFPDFYINFPGMYRKSMWDEIGMKPDTWDNVRIGGAKLKAKGHPVGISLGHSNDPNTTWRGLLWSFGGALQDEAGKKIVLDSKETVEAVKFVAALYKEAMTPEVLSWDDSSNNRYLASGVGSYDHQPDLGLPDVPEEQQERCRRHLRDEAAEGAGAPDHGRRGGVLRHLEIRQEQGSARSSSSSTTPTIGRRPSRRARATTTRASPTSCRSRCRSCRTIRPRRRTTSSRSCRARTSGRPLPVIPGRHGPRSTRSTTTSSSAT